MLGGSSGKRFPPRRIRLRSVFFILNVRLAQNRKSARRLGTSIRKVPVEHLRVTKNASGTAVHNSDQTTKLVVQ